MEFFIYVNGQKRIYEASATKMLVKSETHDSVGIKKVMQEIQVGSLNEIYDLGNRLFMIELQNTSKDSLPELWKRLDSREDIVYASPVLLDEAGQEKLGLTNQVLVRLKLKEDFSLLIENLKNYPVKAISPCNFNEQTYLVTLAKKAEKNAMQTANELHETGLFEYAEPNLTLFIRLLTNDQRFPEQWGLKNTGQSGGTSGIDIKAEDAWGITTGSPNVRVAVIDVGVQLDHPDLITNLLTGYDATGNNSGGAPNLNNTLDPSHGTKCAGIIAAKANNTIGIAGVAYNCKIIPIKMSETNAAALLDSVYIADAIHWAWSIAAADVISMSLSCDETSTMNTALSDAATSGRSNNKGCVLVAGSGNGDIGTFTDVSYPASSPHVIAVGSVNRNGQRGYRSIYGTNLDVVAPGEAIVSTVIGGGYAMDSGTSYACPHVAGIAALLLSYNPNLTQAQVRRTIELTCKKLPGYTFNVNRPNGSWNNEIGHGLANACAALASHMTFLITNGHDNNSGQSTISANNSGYVGTRLNAMPVGFTYEWRANFYGECNRWYIWSNSSSVEISVYLDPGNAGGSLRIECDIYSGSSMLGTAFYYLYVNP